ncbi:hypothetical protein BGZ65_010901 [Modicella reniformis]|uniref:RlpA-like protein double-psi beta-barrel domain-containing protein n=1 Tax=Modicella reniformis TaxID=1440133 RepID=A0A9P6JFT4_9FUNG|nr:hypothetical protein BGZ65_010901 [Modicella reniformis]
MAIISKFTIITIATLVTLVSTAPIDSKAATTIVKAETPSSTTTTSTRHTTATLIPEVEKQNIVSIEGSSSSSSSSSSVFSGRGTWFTDTFGSCGIAFDTNDMIVAMNAHQMDGTSKCGKTVKITLGDKSVMARVTDTCPGQFCSWGSLDLSQAVFKKLAPLSQGVINIKWEFILK